MRNIVIEDAQVGITAGGMACGPVMGHVVAEARIREGEKISYYGLVVVEGIHLFYHKDESRYEMEIAEEYDENEDEDSFVSESFETAEDFYYSFDELKEEDEAHALLLKYLIYIADEGWDETKALIEQSRGKEVGSFEIPVSEIEREYLEELEVEAEAEEEEDEDEEGDEEDGED